MQRSVVTALAGALCPLLTLPALVFAACTVERERELHPVDGSRIHEAGISDPDSPSFHGQLLRDLDYDFAVCARCHGERFDGGPSGSACTECHENGPKACEVCHAKLLESGAHAAHMPRGVLDVDACGGCHRVPRAWDEPGHLFLADGTLDPAPAEVALSGLARHRLDAMPSDAAWSPDTRTCASVYCHGGAFDDAAASNTTPRWDAVGMGEADCGTCHGLPPSDHASDACNACHGDVVDADGSLLDAAQHLDGVVQLGRNGDGRDQCGACHGSETSPAPPPDLEGGTSPSRVGVGAHEAHLLAPHGLTGPIACDECHVVPDRFDDPGHLDSPLPAEVAFGALASASSASPTWLPGAMRCANVFCHGNGVMFMGDASASRVTTPSWVSPGVIACGDCHGVPPTDAPHLPTMRLGDCATCHTSIDALGNFLFTGDRSEHIDGTVSLR